MPSQLFAVNDGRLMGRKRLYEQHLPTMASGAGGRGVGLDTRCAGVRIWWCEPFPKGTAGAAFLVGQWSQELRFRLHSHRHFLALCEWQRQQPGVRIGWQ